MKIKSLIKQYPIAIILLALLVALFCSSEAAAEPLYEIIPEEELEIPEDMSIEVTSSCSGHSYFMQAAARKDGCFLIYSRNIYENENPRETFERVYIDVYDAKGRFQQEISFSSPFDLAVELTDEAVVVYFYSSLLVYNLESERFQYYSIPAGSAINNGLYEILREKIFVSGDWEYRYVKKFGENTGLIRYNEVCEEVLIQMPGSQNNFWKLFLPAITFLLVIVVAVKLISKKRKESI